MKHMECFHPEITDFGCKFCGKRFKELAKRNHHIKTSHLKPDNHRCGNYDFIHCSTQIRKRQIFLTLKSVFY